MNIAKHVITKIGGGSMAKGVVILSRELGRSKTRIYSMTYARERGGTGGLIPARDHLPILQLARSIGIDLTPADLVLGSGDLPPLGTPANDNLATSCNLSAGDVRRDEKETESLP